MRILVTILILALACPVASTAFAADAPRFSGLQRALIEAFARDQARTAEAIAQQKRDAEAAEAAARANADPKHKGKGKGHDKDHDKKDGKGLPPGIAMNLERGKSLPPGIAKQRLPETLQKTLPPAPKGKEIVVVDGRVLLIDVATQKIHDRIESVLLR